VLTGPHDWPWLTLASFLSTTSRKWINKHEPEALPLQPWFCLDFPMEKDLLFPNPLICKEIFLQHPEGQNIFFFFWDTIKQHILKVSRVNWICSHTVLEIHFRETACVHKETGKSSPHACSLSPEVVTAVEWYSSLLLQESASYCNHEHQSMSSLRQTGLQTNRE